MWSPYLPSQVMPLSHCSADRSDELSTCRGDIIQVLCRDNGNRWPGRLANGDRGGLTANCASGALEDGQLDTFKRDPGLSEQQKMSADIPTPTEAGAAMDSPWELSFISEHDTNSESSDDEVYKQKKKKKRKVKKKSESPVAPASVRSTTANPAVTSGPGRKKAPETTGRPLPKRGQTNRAFEPDFEA